MAFSSPNPLFTAQVPKPSPHSAYKPSSSSHTALCSDPACSSSSSLYDVLGVPATATSHEIKAAYRKLARVSHPDVTTACMDQKGSSGEEFARINAAYATLSDPGKRAEYDREVHVGRRWSAKTTVTLSSEPRLRSGTWRNWETDQCW
uniref:J domain-containing protein n=1 Tax=Kalanchoe fedtschenkoi TaxID=63787 RepID=A0A7N0UWB0_KALFE